MAGNSAIVDDFIAAWGAKDLERIMSFFAPDAVYTNVPMDPPNRGTEAIRGMIGGFLGMAQDVEFVVHQQAENPATGIVMNERTDRFKLQDGRWAALRVMGVFELREGKILAWRDYFDMAEAQRELGF
jgi:limonene-1,2-epoxide hydrolase